MASWPASAWWHLSPRASAQAAEPASAALLRVCADPDNMPFSNAKGEGFENKLAELIAQKLDARLEYSWFPEATGYVPNTMGRDACDLVMGYAQGTGLIEDTNPYYYTSYVLIYRAGRRQSRRRRQPVRPAPQGQSHRLLRPDAAGEHPRHAWAGRRTRSRSRSMPTTAPRQAAIEMIGRDRLGQARCRAAVGPGRRLLRRARRGAAQARAAGEGEGGPDARSTASPWACARTSRNGSTRSTS